MSNISLYKFDSGHEKTVQKMVPQTKDLQYADIISMKLNIPNEVIAIELGYGQDLRVQNTWYIPLTDEEGNYITETIYPPDAPSGWEPPSGYVEPEPVEQVVMSGLPFIQLNVESREKVVFTGTDFQAIFLENISLLKQLTTNIMSGINKIKNMQGEYRSLTETELTEGLS